jgi:hypothetical protein
VATWVRCPKTSFYRRASADRDWFDKKARRFDRAYVDPIDLVLVRALPWQEKEVQVLRWRVTELDFPTCQESMRRDQIEVMTAWAERVVELVTLADVEGGKIPAEARRAVLADLDVDAASRDELLDAIEIFVNVSPPKSTELALRKTLRTDEALSAVLFLFGVGPC